eukprot:351776_1
MSSKKNKGKNKVIKSKFNIGDVVLLEIKRKEKELARIKWVGNTILSKNQMYGIEYFKYRIGSHKLLDSKIMDGKIGNQNKTPMFKTTKKGYGTFVDSMIVNRSAEIKWNRKISDKYMKVKRFNKEKITDAAKYGSTKVVKHFMSLLNNKTNNKTKLLILKALTNAIEYNHHSVVQVIFEHYFGFEYNNVENKNDEKKSDNNEHNIHKCVFFNSESLSHIITNKNRKILDMVLFFDKWHLITKTNSVSNAAIYSLFFTKGNLAFIKYFIQKTAQYKDETTLKMYFNSPLMRTNINSTITIAAIKGNRWNYLEYLLVENKYKQLIELQPNVNVVETVPLLLCLVLSMKTYKSLGNVEKFAEIMLNLKANINWFPNISLCEQLKISKNESIQNIINSTLNDTAQVINMSKLFYYDIGKKYKKTQSKLSNKNHFITGSILAAFVYQCSEILDDKTMQEQTETIKNIIAMFIEYGAILYHNDVEHKFNDLINWNNEYYPKNIYIYNNRNNRMRAYWLPESIRGISADNYYSNKILMDMILKDAFAFGIAEHKRKLKVLLKTINIHDGLKFVFVEFLPDYVCWDFEFVDSIKSSAPSRQITPRKYYSSSDCYFSTSWS